MHLVIWKVPVELHAVLVCFDQLLEVVGHHVGAHDVNRELATFLRGEQAQDEGEDLLDEIRHSLSAAGTRVGEGVVHQERLHMIMDRNLPHWSGKGGGGGGRSR